MKYRITDIQNFVEASQCTTLMQAAQRLEISQPALSESMKRLESDLGFVVFYRSRSGIQLTPSGKVFLDKARQAVQALDNLDFSVSENLIFNGRSISIGAHTTVASYSIPKALAYLKKKAPDYKIDLRHDLSRHIQAEIQRGNIDIGLVINATSVPDLVVNKLASDTVGVWKAHRGGDTDTVICNPDLFQTQSILKKWKNKPQKIISTESLDLICRMVDENLGWGILPERAVDLSGFKLEKIKTLPTYQDEIYLVHRPEFGRSPAEKLVIEALRHAILN